MLNVLWAAIQTTEDAPCPGIPPTHCWRCCLDQDPSSTACAQHLRTGGPTPRAGGGELPPATFHWGRITDPNPQSAKDEVGHAHELVQQHGSKARAVPTQAVDRPLLVLGRGSRYFFLLSFSIVSTERLTLDRSHATASHRNICHLSTRRLHHRRAGPSSVITEAAKDPLSPC